MLFSLIIISKFVFFCGLRFLEGLADAKQAALSIPTWKVMGT